MKNNYKRGVIWFLLLTFFSTYLIELILMLKGYSFSGIPDISGQLVVALAMFFPGISAIIVRKFITKEGFGDSGLKLGKAKNYLFIYLLIPLVFALIYGLTWILYQGPDFTLQAFIKQYGMAKLPLPAGTLILAIFISTITFAPFINAIPAFGEELGWRGYLLPKLLPLGVNKALVISGLIWGLWHAPLILMGFKYGNYGVLGILFFSVLLIFIGIFIGYLRMASDSVFLPAFAHGAINAQAYGIWTVLFPAINPLIGGFSGIIGIFIFSILALWVFYKLQKHKSTNLTFNN